jgi:membrane dipeptidase
MTGIHDSLIVIDGLVISKWSREVFADMRKGGLTAANCTCSIWEGFAETMRNIARWKRWFTDNADLITPVHTTADIRRAKAEGKTGIILGFQNTSAFEDQVGYIALFKDLGVGVVQITYNTQNLAGAGCYERRDTGLSGFGYEVVAE